MMSMHAWNNSGWCFNTEPPPPFAPCRPAGQPVGTGGRGRTLLPGPEGEPLQLSQVG